MRAYVAFCVLGRGEGSTEREREGGRRKGMAGWAARYRSGFNAHRSHPPYAVAHPLPTSSFPTTLSTPSTVPRLMHSSASLSLAPLLDLSCFYHHRFEGFLFLRDLSLHRPPSSGSVRLASEVSLPHRWMTKFA